MGIPEFYRNVVEPIFGKDIKISRPRSVSTLYLDANQIFHDVAARVFGYDHRLTQAQKREISSQPSSVREINFRHQLVVELRQLVSAFSPTETLVIAVDGLVPAAKKEQQRSRRFRSAILKTDAERQVFDNASISAGTPLMDEIDAIIRKELDENEAFYPPRIIYSSHRTIGEGEHTIVSLIRSGKVTDDGKNHVIYGLDADWIILAGILPIKNLYLSRSHVSEVLDVGLYRQRVAEQLEVKDPFEAAQEFALLQFPLGNDFIPRSPSMYNMTRGFRAFMGVYRDLKLRITEGTPPRPNWTNLSLLLKAFANYEASLLQDSVAKSKDILLESKDFVDQRSLWYIRNWRLRVDLPTFSRLMKNPVMAEAVVNYASVTPAKLQEMTNEYFRMVAWYFSYYTHGTDSVRFDVYYPYYYAPLFYDMAEYMKPISPARYLRPAPDTIGLWEVDRMMPHLSDYDKKQAIRWVMENKVRDAEGMEYVSYRGSMIGRKILERVFPRQMLTQLALTIAPYSFNILSPRDRGLIANKTPLIDTQPINYNLEAIVTVGDIKGADSLIGAEMSVQKAYIGAAGEIRPYLPNLDFVRVYTYFLNLRTADATLAMSDLFERKGVREPGSAPAPSIASAAGILTLSMSPRGGASVGTYGAGRTDTSRGRSRGRGGRGGRGRGR